MSRVGSLEGVRSVLVVKPSSLGDIVHTLPSVHLLKQAHPRLKITWVANTEWAPLLAGNADLDEVLLFPRKDFRWPPKLPILRDWFRKTRSVKPDLALDFQGLLRSALIGRLSGARDIHCLGDAELACRILSHRIVPAVRTGEHSVTRYLKLVADLGIDTSSRPLAFPLPPGEKPEAASGLEPTTPYLLIHPYSRGENKSLSDECLACIIQGVAPIPVVLVGNAPPGCQPPANCINLLNKTSLSGLIWLIRHAHFTLSVDSGPMHIAAAITDRLLGIHNWSNPLLVGPYNATAWVWKNGSLLQTRDLTPANGAVSKNFALEHVPQIVEFLKGKF